MRQNVDGEMRLTTYGRSTGFCIDPIEKKPLNHFYPGTAVLSFGTAGCNLGCKFCQNWDISKSREVDRLSEPAMPDTIAAAAQKTGCRSVAYTYNDPIIWAEYAIDTAAACRDRGIRSVAVTAGYIAPEARPSFFHSMDAANVDLKSFSDDFYEKVTYSRLQPVLETLHWLKHESDVWFEITNLLIPNANDSTDELKQMCEWIVDAVGPDVPIHFTAFHPDFRMTDRERTPHETLLTARQIAIDQGIKFAYVGNVHDVQNQSTYCSGCGQLLIERDWHQLGTYSLIGNRCNQCSETIPGHFDQKPGTWGRKRQPIRISQYGVTPDNLVQLQNVTANSQPAQKQNRMDAVQECPTLTAEQESAIHLAACEVFAATVNRQKVKLSDESVSNTADTIVMGTFVTAKRNGQLRGCCGTVGQPMKLLPALAKSAGRTATHDHRFPPVSPSELPHLSLDVTLLFNFQPVTEQGDARIGAIEVGKHGLKIVRGDKSGLLLPIVAIEHNWDAETFLDNVCRKAGLPDSAWREADTQLVRFEGRMIEREIPESILATGSVTASTHPVSQAEVGVLAKFAQQNIMALHQGAVPACFPANCSDCTVTGIAIRLSFPGVDDNVTLSQLQLRGGMPLQMTLLKMTESAGTWLREANVPAQMLSGMRADLILFADPAMHGHVASAALSDFEATSRAVLVLAGEHTAWSFNRYALPADLLQSATRAARVPSPESAQVFSLAAVSSADSFSYANVPQPRPGTAIRPPSVAGRFYPSSVPALKAIVKKCLGEIPSEKETWPAAMIPHAGLQYSGRIAGQVLARLQIPSTVIIIGPKHTRDGVEWAVAPHQKWQLPGGELESDPELAKLLADGIDGLELDAAAHANEHCIEVELPLIQYLSPNTKVVGLAIGGGSLDRCQKFGEQLANVISQLDECPLLLISSDMNHFAADAENRRLDEMALAALETLDPAQLYDVVTKNNISMCGMLPSVIVMEALRHRNQLTKTKRVGYATSGDITGDLSRVVGYAGMVLG